MPLRERVFHLAAHEECIGDCAYQSEANFVFDHVVDDGSGNAFARVRAKFMAVVPILERPLGLHVGEVVVPFDSVMRAIHCARRGKKGKTRKVVTMVEPTPAANAPAGSDVGATRLSPRIFVPLAAGMMRGRLSGFEKKANTRSTGNGTHCSNWR